MAWIRTYNIHNADPALLDAYGQLREQLPPEYAEAPEPAAIVQSHSLDPKAMLLNFSAGMHLIAGPSPLSRREREMINTVVSAANKCFY